MNEQEQVVGGSRAGGPGQDAQANVPGPSCLPWTPGGLPTDCPTCGAILWVGPPYERPECCGNRVRISGSDSRPWAWYVDVCQRAKANYRAAAIRALEKLS